MARGRVLLAVALLAAAPRGTAAGLTLAKSQTQAPPPAGRLLHAGASSIRPQRTPSSSTQDLLRRSNSSLGRANSSTLGAMLSQGGCMTPFPWDPFPCCDDDQRLQAVAGANRSAGTNAKGLRQRVVESLQERPCGSGSNVTFGPPGGCPNYPNGPWFESAQNFYVVLSANLGDQNGWCVSTSVTILPSASSQCFANLNGAFLPSDSNSFLASADDVVHTLHAELADGRGGWQQRSLSFSPGDCATNGGGHFGRC